jgi:hypothetical protein
MTYNAWQQAAEGKPIKVATEAKNKKISDLLNFGLDWEGRKTNSFYLNLMEAMEGVDTGKATIDLHMTRMLFDRDAPTDAQYELAEKMVRLLATKVNVPPRQIQAASWVTQKAKGLFKNFREKGQHKTLNDKELRFLSFQRALGDYSHAFKDKGAEFLPTTAALREPSSDIRARTEVITGEAVPSTKVPAGQVSEIPYKNKLAFNGQLVKAGVVDKIAKVIGLKSKIRVSEGTGGYDKSINPNMIVRVVNFNPMVAKADADALSDAMSYVFQQDATPYFRADPKLISTGQVGFLIRFNPAKITITQERKLYKALQEELGDGAGYTKLKGAEIVLINYRDKESGNPFLMDDVAFEAAVDKFREKANAIIGIESSTAFGAESEYKYNDWENERTGKAIVERIQNSRADRPDISKGLDDLRNTFIKDAREAVKESGAIPRFSLQDSVEVDGVDRPTTDSRGRPIFSTLDGIKNFWRWFGDSVFVDDKGRPMVMYHGTAVDIEEFIPKQANAIFITPQVKFAADFKDGSLGGVATWSEGWMVENYEDILTPKQIERAKIKALFKIDAETKKDYRLTSKSHHSAFVETAEFRQELLDEMPSRANVLPLFVKADNPFNYENQNHVRQVVDRLFLDSGVDLETEPNGLIRFKDNDESMADKQYSENEVYKMLSKGYWPLIEQAETQEAIRGLEFDGFSVQEALTKNYAVYDSAQLKSSIGNTGEFSPKKKSIRYSIGVRGPDNKVIPGKFITTEVPATSKLPGVKLKEIDDTEILEWLDVAGTSFEVDDYIDVLNKKYGTNDVIEGPYGVTRITSAWEDSDLTADELRTLKSAQSGGRKNTKISTAQVQQFLADGGSKIEFQDVVLGGAPKKKFKLTNVGEARRFAEQFTDLVNMSDEDVVDAANEWATVEVDNPTQFNAYQLPGGTNYREAFVTVPPKISKMSFSEWKASGMIGEFSTEGVVRDGGRWVDGHGSYSGIDNPVVRIRFNDRVDAEGKKVLFLEELQPPNNPEFGKMPKSLQDRWLAIGLKRMIRHAAEENYDKIAWTTGEQQVERYASALRESVDPLNGRRHPKVCISKGIKFPNLAHLIIKMYLRMLMLRLKKRPVRF